MTSDTLFLTQLRADLIAADQRQAKRVTTARIWRPSLLPVPLLVALALLAVLITAATAFALYRASQAPHLPAGIEHNVQRLLSGEPQEPYFNKPQLRTARLLVTTTTADGKITFWSTPMTNASGHPISFCSGLLIRGNYNGFGCGNGGGSPQPIAAVGSIGVFIHTPHTLGVITGYLRPPVTRVDVLFQDGSQQRAVVHNGYFMAIITAKHLRRGHLPNGVIGYSATGKAGFAQVPPNPTIWEASNH